jgi:hypothetical protein
VFARHVLGGEAPGGLRRVPRPVYPGATLTALSPADHALRWTDAGDPDANKKLNLCLKQKGYQIAP